MRPERTASPVWWAVVAWIGVIFFSSTSTALRLCERAYDNVTSLLFGIVHSPDQSFSLLHFLVDKALHVTLFCVFALLLWMAIGDRPRKFLLIVLGGAILGSCSEYLQSFFPDRDPAIRDVIINTGGTALGATISLLIARKSEQRKNSKVTQGATAF